MIELTDREAISLLRTLSLVSGALYTYDSTLTREKFDSEWCQDLLEHESDMLISMLSPQKPEHIHQGVYGLGNK